MNVGRLNTTRFTPEQFQTRSFTPEQSAALGRAQALCQEQKQVMADSERHLQQPLAPTESLVLGENGQGHAHLVGKFGQGQYDQLEQTIGGEFGFEASKSDEHFSLQMRLAQPGQAHPFEQVLQHQRGHSFESVCFHADGSMEYSTNEMSPDAWLIAR